MNDSQAQIFRALDALLDRDDRWRVVPSPGCVTVTRGWPDGSADTVIILSPETAYAVREDPQGRQAWSVRGTTDQIVAAVHELPLPEPIIVHSGERTTMARTPLTVSTYVSVRNGCALNHSVVDTEDVDVVEFTVGGGGQEPFVIVFDAAMLRQFLNQGATALLQVDERSAQDRGD